MSTIDTENVHVGPNGEQIVREGQAEIIFGKDQPVFYNPVQEFNRDMSVLMLRILKQKRAQEGKTDGIRIVEALAASGLRSIRYVKEVDGVEWTMANDIDANAVATIERNRDHNGVPAEKLRTSQCDAKFLMHKLRHGMRNINKPSENGPVDVVDLDPYGGAYEFLDGAVQLVADGGLLMVTCTDAAVLCGNHSETCFARYNVMPPRNTMYCHEIALRALLACIAMHASRYKRYIVPVVSMHADFYVRVFVRVYTGANESKKTASQMASVYQCVSCPHHEVQPIGKVTQAGNSVVYSPGRAVVDSKCSVCGSAYQVGGPLWNAPLHDPDWIQMCLDHLDQLEANQKLPEAERPAGARLPFATQERMKAVLRIMKDELPDVPYFYDIARLASTLSASSPKLEAFRSAIIRLGHRISLSHTEPNSAKTDIPSAKLWDVMRAWWRVSIIEQARRKLPEGQQDSLDVEKVLSEAKAKFPPKSVAHTILSKEITTIPENVLPDLFSIIPAARLPPLKRFLPNPRPNWGPGTRPVKAINKAAKAAAGEAASKGKKRKRDQRDEEDAALQATSAQESSASKDQRQRETQTYFKFI